MAAVREMGGWMQRTKAVRTAGGRPRRSMGVNVGLPHVFMVLAGLATFVLVSSVLSDRSATAEVWMVAIDVPAGSSLEARDLTAVQVSANDPLLPMLLASNTGIPFGTVRHELLVGEPLLASDLVAAEESDVGRTFTIPVESIVLDGLGLDRGDRLDVIGVGAAGAMEYVVVDVEVVRLPGHASSTAFAAASSRNAWVTVRIDDRQALLLSAALDRGDVELVRSTGAMSIVLESSS